MVPPNGCLAQSRGKAPSSYSPFTVGAKGFGTVEQPFESRGRRPDACLNRLSTFPQRIGNIVSISWRQPAVPGYDAPISRRAEVR